MSVQVTRPDDVIERATQAFQAVHTTANSVRLHRDALGALLGWIAHLESRDAASEPAGEPKRGLWATSTLTDEPEGIRHTIGLKLGRSRSEVVGRIYLWVESSLRPNQREWNPPSIAAMEVTPELWAKRWEDPI